MKVCEKCGIEIYARDGENRCKACEHAAADGKRRKRAAALRKERHQIMTDLGLVRVKGMLGGTYYE